MKYKKMRKRLEGRISNFESDPAVRSANNISPGTFHKPGSFKK